MTERRIDFGFWGQVLSAGAVVLSLVFVGLEVRESARQTALNTQALQVEAYQELIGRIIDINLLFLDNPDVAGGTVTDSNFDSLSSEQLQRFRMLMLTRLRFGDLAFYMQEQGMLDRERFESAIRPLSNDFCSEFFAEMWAGTRFNFVERYQAYIDSGVAQC